MAIIRHPPGSIFTLIFLILALDLNACGHQSPDPAAQSSEDGKTSAPLLGFALNVHHISDLELYLRSVDEIADLGANALAVLTPMFMSTADSTSIEHRPGKCPTEAELIAILKRGKEHGMRTMLLPIVLIEHPEEDDWRGVIRPEDWAAWWRSYDDFLDRFLAIASTAGTDIFVIGSELNSTEDQTDRWRAAIDRARGQFNGKLTYSANWDRYWKVTFWDALDLIGVSSYFELAEDEHAGAPPCPTGPDVRELAVSWVKERDRLLEFADQWNLPLVLTEVGYPSLPTAAARPWSYQAPPAVTADHAMQALCWEAFFKAWAPLFESDPETASMAGFFGYHWDPYRRGGGEDRGYGVKGKPAFRIIAREFQQSARRSE